MRIFLTLLSVLLFGAPAVQAQEEPKSDTSAVLDLFNQHAQFSLPRLDKKQLRQLAKGDIVKFREVPEDADEPQRVVGLLRSSQPRDLLWLALRDLHWSAAKELTEVLLSGHEVWPRIWYQHLDAPRPLADRHWVLRIMDSWELEEATSGACWEHWWEIHPDGQRLAAEALESGRIPGQDRASTEKAVFVPVNDGAWMICTLPGGDSLLGYHVRFVAGGRIPDRIIVDYGMATLGRILRKVEKRAEEVPSHYRGKHYLIPGGDGEDLKLYRD